jgi:hypothetical protein
VRDGVDTNPGLENVGGYCTTGEVAWSPAVIGGKSRRKGAHLDDQRRSQVCAPDVGIVDHTPGDSSARRYTQVELVAEPAEL